MGVRRMKILGSSNPGIYLKVAGGICLAPEAIADRAAEMIGTELGLDVVRASVYQSRLLGIFVAGNSRAILLPHLVSDRELRKLRDEVDAELVVVKSKITALGNTVLANDYGALVSPTFEESAVDAMERALGVRVRRGLLAGIPVVGSVAVVNNGGGVASPSASEEEIEAAQEVLDVEFGTGTVNDGLPYVKIGAVASDSGLIVGYESTPLEIDNLSSFLGIG